MLEWDPKKRISAVDALKDPFFKKLNSGRAASVASRQTAASTVTKGAQKSKGKK